MNTDFARQQMVLQQVRAWDVLDTNVLSGMSEVPRELFVPDGYEALAFADTEIPLGHDQCMMTPTLEGRLLQALQLAGGESVLEVGTGSGYLTACLATLAAKVCSIDVFEDFLERADDRLNKAGIKDCCLEHIDATISLPEGTFDAIVVTGSMPSMDERWVDALNPGGRLIMIIGEGPAMSATRITRIDDRNEDDSWQSDTLFETNIPPLINGAMSPQFSF